MHRKNRITYAIALVLALALAGCATTTSITPPVLQQLSDGKVLEAVSVITRAPFSQDQVVQRGRECDPAQKDSDGNIVTTKDCKEAYVRAHGGPNIGTVATDSSIKAAGAVGAAAVFGISMPSPKVNVNNTQTGASASTGAVTQTGASASTGAVTQTGASATANPTANAGSLTTGTVTGGSTVSGPNVGN